MLNSSIGKATAPRKVALKPIVIGALSLVAALNAGCDREMSAAEQKHEVEAVKAHYRQMDIGGGFSVWRIKAKGQSIVGQLSIADSKQECSFREKGIGDLQMIASLACPYADDAVWSQIKSTHDIKLELSCKGQLYSVQSCRQIRRAGTS